MPHWLAGSTNKSFLIKAQGLLGKGIDDPMRADLHRCQACINFSRFISSFSNLSRSFLMHHPRIRNRDEDQHCLTQGEWPSARLRYSDFDEGIQAWGSAFGSHSAGMQCAWTGTYLPVLLPAVWLTFLVNSLPRSAVQRISPVQVVRIWGQSISSSGNGRSSGPGI